MHKAFFDKRGQLKIHFYQPRDTIQLSRSGTKELLSAINARIDIVEHHNQTTSIETISELQIYKSQ